MGESVWIGTHDETRLKTDRQEDGQTGGREDGRRTDGRTCQAVGFPRSSRPSVPPVLPSLRGPRPSVSGPSVLPSFRLSVSRPPVLPSFRLPSFRLPVLPPSGPSALQPPDWNDRNRRSHDRRAFRSPRRAQPEATGR